MAGNVVDRRQASRITLISQVAAVVFLAGAAVVMAVGLPGQEPARAMVNLSLGPISADTAAASADQQPTRPVDSAGVAARLATFSNAPQPRTPVAEAPPTAQPGETPAPTPAPAATEVKYLGSIAIGPRLAALVMDGARQRMVGEGDRLSIGVVEAIEPDLVRVDTDAGLREFRLAERSAAVTGRGKTDTAARPMSSPQALRQQARQPYANQAQPTISGKGADAARVNREFINAMRDKLKASGRYNTQEELNEALAKEVESAGYQFTEEDKQK